MQADAKRAAKLDQRAGLLTQGYQKRSAELGESLGTLCKEGQDAAAEFVAFKVLFAQARLEERKERRRLRGLGVAALSAPERREEALCLLAPGGQSVQRTALPAALRARRLGFRLTLLGS